MDPTKSFDHLDPKLKETYARVMGTDTNNSNNATQPAANPTAGLSATPTTFDPTQPAADPNQLASTSPLSPGLNQSVADAGPNPGTGPTIGTSDPNTMFSTPLNTPAITDPAPASSDPNSPATSSFFSNSSPATTDPTQSNSSPIEPPVTPYVPEGLTPSGQAPAADGSYSQPLPSPSSVNQTHETSPLIKVLYIIGAVIFFAVYTIFWIKVFNLPFLF